MAARLNKAHQDDVRLKIQTSQLVNRLQNFALGKAGVDLDSSRLKAIEILLRKSLPDLSSVTLEGNPNNPIAVVTRIELVAPDDSSAG